MAEAVRLPIVCGIFVTCTRWLSPAPLHELVKSLEVGTRSAVGKELSGLQGRQLLRHRSGHELVYASAIFPAMQLHSFF